VVMAREVVTAATTTATPAETMAVVMAREAVTATAAAHRDSDGPSSGRPPSPKEAVDTLLY
jgi:hypothetical protein